MFLMVKFIRQGPDEPGHAGTGGGGGGQPMLSVPVLQRED
jgi:hypothetical protein